MCRKMIYLIFFCLLFSLLLTNIAYPQDENLVGWWKFDEASGNTAYDSSGNSYNGYLMGNPQWVDGYKNGAVQLDPSGEDYIELNIDSLIPTLNECTFAIWVNWAGRTDADDGLGWQRIIDIGSSQSNYIYLCPSTGASTMAMRLALVNTSTGVWDEFDSDIGPLPTGWHHIAITVSESDTTMILYVDSEEVGSKTNCRNSINNLGETGNNWLGRSEYSDPYFEGALDDFRIYNRVLSPEEISKVAEPEKTSAPVPANGEVITQTDVTLQWDPGIYAAQVDGHHVYIGDNWDDVNEGAASTDKGLTSSTSFSITGLEAGLTYYWRIDEVSGGNTWKGRIWSFRIQPNIAYNPVPSDGATYVNPDIDLEWSSGAGAIRHNVYLGTNFEDVNNATRAAPLDVLLKAFHSSNTFSPGTLELNTTYYWRIDEIKGATTLKGDIWSFTTISEIAKTDPNLVGWWKLDEEDIAVDWSGNYNSGTLINGPVSTFGPVDGALQFDGINDYVDLPIGQLISTLNESTLTIWVNFTNPEETGDEGGILRPIVNFGTDTTNYAYLSPRYSNNGAMHAAIVVDNTAYDLDATSGTLATGWHHVAMVTVPNVLSLYLDSEPVGTMATEFTLSDLGVTTENWLGKPEWPNDAYFSGSLDDFRIYNRVLTQDEIATVSRGYPALAGNPIPANGSMADIVSAATLSWVPGDNAIEHDVYFGTDKEAVETADIATADIYRGKQDANNYTLPEALDWNQTYYWRIDEYNADGTIGKGRIWTFTTADYILVDDFEAYNDLNINLEGSKRIFFTWLDGYDNPTVNGSTMGYPDPAFADGEHFVETTIVHGGSQSAPMFYDNSTASYSEVTVNPAELTVGTDWTKGDIEVLTIWFYGAAANTATEQLYVKVNYARQVISDISLTEEAWQSASIDLTALGTNLSNVTSFTIGLERTGSNGGSGVLFIDDVRLYLPEASQ